MSNKYYYELTDGWGENLRESIRDYEIERKWSDMVSEEHTYLMENMLPGKEQRDRLVDKIMENLSEDDIEVIADIALTEKDDQTLSLFGDPQKTLEEKITLWLIENECPAEIFNEKNFVKHAGWVWEDANEDVQLQWDDIDQKDDYKVALFFGYLKYPPYNSETNCYEEGHIQVETANKLLELEHLMNEAAKNNEQGYRSAECLKIGAEIEDTKNSLILVSGVRTDYDEFELPRSMPVSEIPTCPYCGVTFDYNSPAPVPKTTDDAFNYLLRADSDDPMATCPNCGNGGEEFVEVWLKYAGCPLPEEYLDKRLWETMKLLAA